MLLIMMKICIFDDAKANSSIMSVDDQIRLLEAQAEINRRSDEEAEKRRKLGVEEAEKQRQFEEAERQ
jgi:predicted dithiol-disulfide oxidoreductase (DUF899 family)